MQGYVNIHNQGQVSHLPFVWPVKIGEQDYHKMGSHLGE